MKTAEQPAQVDERGWVVYGCNVMNGEAAPAAELVNERGWVMYGCSIM